MTPAEYFHIVAKPSYAEFAKDPGNLRLAMIACMTVYHCVDALALAHGDAPGQQSARLIDLCPPFGEVKAVTFVSKHLVLHSTFRKGLSIDHLEQGDEAAFDDGTYYDDGTSHFESERVVVLAEAGKPTQDVGWCLLQAIRMLERETAGS